ncbi:Di-sulfide bridge nucleocytoplasmic transport domain-containing protein [Glomus cerebriforme]|uniref:Di-sulfide bridge nucleocytoplasmic transport domain-containing protein n=1 Tax=Glomus cerebriforme TaxID=658196 RepID=A0A397TKP9_9GLOM|nr:Di-sulfide bridge nucleocytoplasmic transport domain-containing protein [Glomus cerebriforme]
MTLLERENESYDEQNDNNDYYNTASMSMGLGPASPRSSPDTQTSLGFQRDQIPRMIIIHPPKNIFRKLFENFLGFCLWNVKAILFTASLAFTFVFLVSLNADHQKEVEIHKSDAARKVKECSLKYIENRCNPTTRAPYLEESCAFWESCMDQDPNNTVRSSEIYAKQFARIISIFLENLSYEARIMLFMFLVMIFGYIVIKNHR